jgi:hypothetical protein
MKRHLHLLAILGLTLVSISNINCKKGITDPVTLDKAAGKWSINAIRMKVFYGSVLAKDSTIPWTPIVENYVDFDGVSNFKYCFNSTNSKTGQYKLYQSDSVSLKFLDSNEEMWKILLLTGTNFNIEKTSTNNTSFPGATVITYQGFVR